ncbi:MAG: sensor histidine kinase KdpD [Atopobiaceae bacterium]|nr:sensor histidine kinase KdpD [Atopobiaceae bacterium]
MEDDIEARRDPDRILRAIELDRDEAASLPDGAGAPGARGHLRIFFGYAPGVGKTYAMLRSAHEAQRAGIDVVAAYIEPHSRPETQGLVAGLETLPPLDVDHNGIHVHELDLDALLGRHPRLALVDELAHTNDPTCRHAKRYQDVEELLQAGIDVYTTVNVQHLESLNDRVAAITGVVVTERIPDRVFDDADQVELVDIEPDQLIGRLREGKVYRGEGAERALENFFDVKNLTALREIALRRCADRVNRMVERVRAAGPDAYYTGEHVLACLSGAPSNGRIVRTAARMARAFDARFTALLVEGDDGPATGEAAERLKANMRLAEQLGAKVETVYGDDVARQIADYARISGVSKVVMGRSGARRHLLDQAPLTDRIAALAPDLDIYIIPDESQQVRRWHERHAEDRYTPSDVAKALGLLVAVSVVALLMERLGVTVLNIAVLYGFGVLLTAVVVPGVVSSVVMSLAAVLMFNFLFTDPRYSFTVFDPQYFVTFAIIFLTATIASSLARRVRRQARAAAASTWRTQVLLECDQMLGRASNAAEDVDVMGRQLVRLLRRDVVYYPAERGVLGPGRLFLAAADGAAATAQDLAGTDADSPCLDERERGVAAWVFKNNKRAGAGTDTLGSAACLYLAVRKDEQVFGVVGILVGTEAIAPAEQGIVLSILGETALALEREAALAEREEAAVVARNEQLRANLLRSVSHDLRTPLTSITGNASVLLSDGADLAPEAVARLEGDIYDDSLWLGNLVENLLAMTRIEEGEVELHLEPELLGDVVDEAMRHVSRDVAAHELAVDDGELLVCRMDARLVVQVLVNLVNNAVQHTPAGSRIQVTCARDGRMARVDVTDDGPGIATADLPHLFERFYVGGQGEEGSGRADARRGTGLGLALCRSIVEAHGGTIEASNVGAAADGTHAPAAGAARALTVDAPHGARFSFTLPLEEA